MRLVFFGDVVGRSGRDGLARHVPVLRDRFHPEVVIANVENAARGFGVTLKIVRELTELGIHVFTTGNHVWDQRELVGTIDSEPRLLRPLNYPEGTPGRGLYWHKLPDGRGLLVLNPLGRLFTGHLIDDPFAATEAVLARQSLGTSGVNAIFVDFHAETTAEKMALANVLDGRVSAVVGTHTHVPTADARILPRGTAYLTDAGMCGDYDSVIGNQKDAAVWRFTRKIPGERLAPAEGEATVCGVFLETDDSTGLAKRITPFRCGGVMGEERAERTGG